MFGLSMSTVGANFTSQITFGWYDETRFAGIDVHKYIDWHPQIGTSRWQVEVWDIGFGNQSIYSNSYSTVALLDSFVRNIKVPPRDFDDFMAKILPKNANTTFIECNTTSGFCYYQGLCSSNYDKLPKLYIQFADYNLYTINPQDYTLQQNNNGSVCTLLVEKSADNTY